MMIREWCYRLIVERLRLTEFGRSLVRRLFDEGGSLHSIARALGYANK
jgi:IS30 family transposase